MTKLILQIARLTLLSLLAFSSDCFARTIRVAVIDTGVDFQHPALKNKLEISNINGIKYGWDFSGYGSTQDNNGHGTHIASLIAMENNLGQSPEVRLIILKYYDNKDQKKDPMASSIEALNKALDLNVDIVNYSGGGPIFNQEEFEVLKKMNDKGILVVAAAGNENQDIDQKGFYPASYDLPNIISVAAVDKEGLPVKSSNHGTKAVHIAAWGKTVWAALPHGKYGALTGTSQATAKVTNSIVFYLQSLAKNPAPQKTRERLMKTGVISQRLKKNNAASARLDARRLLFMKDIDDPIVKNLSNNKVFSETKMVEQTRTLAGGASSP